MTHVIKIAFKIFQTWKPWTRNKSSRWSVSHRRSLRFAVVWEQHLQGINLHETLFWCSILCIISLILKQRFWLNKILTSKSTGKRYTGRSRRRWEDNIRMGLKEIGNQYEQIDWFGSGYELLENPCECDIEPPSPISHGVSSPCIHGLSGSTLVCCRWPWSMEW